ncbi:hypothetical protein [Burkholderia perseverans]|uniref:hypothetical protein n=1 Tax=Burkholderia perseverans TaxID=2615214 RepID=UPI001FEFDABD|nr:hypothetical protein [Burkholderia perseverans]
MNAAPRLLHDGSTAAARAARRLGRARHADALHHCLRHARRRPPRERRPMPRAL